MLTRPCTAGSMIMLSPLSCENSRSTARRSASSKSKFTGAPTYCFCPDPGTSAVNVGCPVGGGFCGAGGCGGFCAGGFCGEGAAGFGAGVCGVEGACAEPVEGACAELVEGACPERVEGGATR